MVAVKLHRLILLNCLSRVDEVIKKFKQLWYRDLRKEGEYVYPLYYTENGWTFGNIIVCNVLVSCSGYCFNANLANKERETKKVKTHRVVELACFVIDVALV